MKNLLKCQEMTTIQQEIYYKINKYKYSLRIHVKIFLLVSSVFIIQ